MIRRCLTCKYFIQITEEYGKCMLKRTKTGEYVGVRASDRCRRWEPYKGEP